MNAKRLFIICSITILSAMALYYGLAGSKADANFKWISPSPALKSVVTTTGNTMSVPFEFRVAENVSEVSLEIEDKAMERMGVYLEKYVVLVTEGVASSTAIFRLNKGIRAGHHRLKIIAKDKATGDVISIGEIPFNVNMLDVIWECSC